MDYPMISIRCYYLVSFLITLNASGKDSYMHQERSPKCIRQGPLDNLGLGNILIKSALSFRLSGPALQKRGKNSL